MYMIKDLPVHMEATSVVYHAGEVHFDELIQQIWERCLVFIVGKKLHLAFA